MKNIILDHVRRWWWLFALGAVYAAALGWSVATSATTSGYWHGKHSNSLILSLAMTWNSMLVAQSLCLAVFTGAMLLLFDMQRGLVRPVAVLPLTGRQIGLSWWLATVVAPACLSAALLFVGGGAFHLFHQDTTIPVARLLLADLLIFLWLGSVFVTYFTNYATQGLPWGKLYNFIASVTIIWMLFGFALSLNAQKSPTKWALFLGLGLLLTLFGWWCAGQFIPGKTKPLARVSDRARARLRAHTILTRLPIRYASGTHPAVAGGGGIPLLGTVTFFQAILFCLITAVWMPLALAWQGQFRSWSSAIELVAGLVAAFWAISFFVFLPVLKQLRFLRTLPLSASRLALVLIVLALLPLLALGALTAGVAWLSTDTSTTFLVLKNFLFILAPASLCLAVAIWRGTGTQTYMVLLLTLIGFQAACYRNIPLSLVGAVVAICILLSFLIARLALRRSRHAYRVPATPFGNFPWMGSK